MEKYRQAISDAITELEDNKERLIENLFEIAINGELRDWAKDVELGEDFYFSRELFQSLDDKNIKLLIALIENIEMTVFRLSTSI